MSDKFIDDKITHIESDIKKIQTKPTMYISYLGSRGALHLCYELINNAIDECINTNSPGNLVTINLDESTNTIMVSDNGRGIAENDIEIVCTTLQSGSKFTREGSGEGSAGENGVGLTACNALSERFEIIVTRYGKKTSIGFVEGEMTEPLTTKTIKDKDKHGTTFIVKPSKIYMGEECDIIADDLIEWIEKIIYLVPQDISINLSIKKKGKESLITKKYKNKYGLYDYCKKLCKKPLLDPIHLIGSKKLKETIHGREVERFIGLEFAFTYNSDSIEFESDSFCNFVNTIDNGVHVDAVKQAIMQIISKATKDSLSERDAKKLEITFNDVAQGLVLTVNLSTNFPPMFTSQTKSKVGNNELFKVLRTVAYSMITKYFTDNPKELKKCCDRVKTNAKARIEATKVRNSVIKGETNNLAEHLIENFAPCNNRGKNDYRELFIIEGKSAKGSASAGRFDRDTQAIFSLRGVPLNAFGVRIDKVLANEELKALVSIMGCNIGTKFDISKLKYNKIIIMADSDSDGYNITSLMCAFFMVHYKPLVDAGYIYKAVAPLYELKDKKNRFVRNKQEYINVFDQAVRKSVVVYDDKTDKVLNDDQVQQLLLVNRSYLEELNKAASQLSIDSLLLEYIILHRHEKTFYKNFRRRYPELTIDDDGVLSGVHDGRYQILIMDKIFEKRIKTVERYLFEYNTRTHIYVKEKTSDGLIDKGLLSIGEFMSMVQKFQPVIKTRFKGLIASPCKTSLIAGISC